MMCVFVCVLPRVCVPLSDMRAPGLADESARGSGSTATVGMIRRDHLIVANVGDSRAVLCRKGKVRMCVG